MRSADSSPGDGAARPRGDRAIAVLGGSGAFTPALAKALCDAAADLPGLDIRLYGRDAARTEAVARFCGVVARAHAAPHRYVASASAAEAARAADVVVVQVRVGGWDGRTADETLPLRFGLPGDETIGPGGLMAAIRGTRTVAALAREAAAVARPDAAFIVMSNPLGILVRALDATVGARAFGLCELPGETLRRALALVEVDPSAASADYLGLNHQGWFVRATSRDGRDLLPGIFDAVDRLPDGGWFRIDGALMRREGALPTPYMRLHLRRDAEAASLRARAAPRGDELASLARELYAAYATTVDASPPPALARRATPWFPEALVPALVGRFGGPARDVYASIPNAGAVPGLPAGAVVEVRAAVGPEGVRVASFGGPAAEAGGRYERFLRFLRRIAAFEEAALEASLAPTRRSVAAALREHPFTADDGDAAGRLAEAILAATGGGDGQSA